ncbi:protein fem-1 homolog b-like [Plakobranchus ocellatus]|uniref:Protein fem-1 homolog b-like n=1 Tax=Plakobranchus ocellatus TaxID=259542 RepID=A0AAV3XTG4_9GAST|nr:protein fem-1 homolog b-like [Plakobranchus ocellatus]
MASLTDEETEKLKEKVHSAAKHGMAISIFAVLWNMDKAVVKEIISHVTEYDGQKTTPLVVAAMGGATKVVQVLLSNFEVDMEQRCTVRFDGYVIQEATALWCAAGAGHLDIVKLLVQNGACVNSKTATDSTPLRAACFDGHLEIVKYLIEQGADLTIPNKYNNTCLMISCYKGHTEVVRHLLEKGADPDLKAHCGATSIHFAAECGRLDVVRELVHFGASMLANDLGMTPLMVAAECGREKIVNFFLQQRQCTKLSRIEALELLGASFANDKETYNLNKTFKYMMEAMNLRMKADNSGNGEPQGIVPKPSFGPIAAYGNHRECQNIEELAAIRLNRDALHMEALTVRERILGSKNPEIPHPVIFRGAVFADNGRFDRCIALWMHAMVLRQVNGRSINKDLLRFSQVFSQMVTIGVQLDFVDVESVIKHGLEELQIFLHTGSTGQNECKFRSSELYQTNILSMIYLITIALRVVQGPEQTETLYKLIYQFIKIKPCLKNGYSPLHIILDPGICVDDFHVNSVVIFPDKRTASAFISCGADVDALDYSRNTPLHVITNAKLSADQEAVRLDVIKLLLEQGAHSDIVNVKRETPYTLATSASRHTLKMYGNVTLRCLAARCIKRHKIDYKDNIPHCLEEFVEWH